jgi:hypothetical protein
MQRLPHTIDCDSEDSRDPVLPPQPGHTRQPRSIKRASVQRVCAGLLHAALKEARVSSEAAGERMDVSATMVDMKRRGERAFELADVLMLGQAGLDILNEAVAIMEGKIALGLTPEQAGLWWAKKAARATEKITAAIANDGKIDASEDADIRPSLAEVNSAARVYRRVTDARGDR